jgi:hypothetical protein
MLAEDWGWETVPGWSGKKVWAVLKATLLPGRFPMSEGAAWHKADLSAFPADA